MNERTERKLKVEFVENPERIVFDCPECGTTNVIWHYPKTAVHGYRNRYFSGPFIICSFCQAMLKISTYEQKKKEES